MPNAGRDASEPPLFERRHRYATLQFCARRWTRQRRGPRKGSKVPL